MKPLTEYLQSAEITAAELARRLGTSRGYIHDLLSGRRKPSMKTASAIAAITDGKVPISSWVEDVGDHAVLPLETTTKNVTSDGVRNPETVADATILTDARRAAG